jgi:hypothetical protein
MPRCPLCRSALVTIGFGLYPTAICTNCGARWIQDGHQQRAIQPGPRTHFVDVLVAPASIEGHTKPGFTQSSEVPH